jgi:hypothetical protein
LIPSKYKRPAPLEQDEETFFKKIFMNFSLIFEPRSGNVDTHVQLCSRILLILEQVGREYAGKFSVQTWELLLKVVLGSADLLLKDPADEPNLLSSKLCPLLLKVIFGKIPRNILGPPS